MKTIINRRGNGRGIAWLREHVGHTGTECLIWPLSCDNHGHAVVSVDGSRFKAARVMCKMAHGDPPHPSYETAHSCGCGHKGCVNPQHLSWKTRTENQRDRRAHGTAGRGPSGFKLHKLTELQVAEIRALGPILNKEELGRRYNVTPANIAKILSGRTWKNGKRTIGGGRVVPELNVSKGAIR